MNKHICPVCDSDNVGEENYEGEFYKVCYDCDYSVRLD